MEEIAFQEGDSKSLETLLKGEMENPIKHFEKELKNIYTHGTVLSHKDQPEGTVIEVNLPEKWQNFYQTAIRELLKPRPAGIIL